MRRADLISKLAFNCECLILQSVVKFPCREMVCIHYVLDCEFYLAFGFDLGHFEYIACFKTVPHHLYFF